MLVEDNLVVSSWAAKRLSTTVKCIRWCREEIDSLEMKDMARMVENNDTFVGMIIEDVPKMVHKDNQHLVSTVYLQ